MAEVNRLIREIRAAAAAAQEDFLQERCQLLQHPIQLQWAQEARGA